jgi:hypothetical protein
MELSGQVQQGLQWALSEHVLQYLKTILDRPHDEHVSAIPAGGLRLAHVYGLVALLNDGRGQAWGKHFNISAQI